MSALIKYTFYSTKKSRTFLQCFSLGFRINLKKSEIVMGILCGVKDNYWQALVLLKISSDYYIHASQELKYSANTYMNTFYIFRD